MNAGTCKWCLRQFSRPLSKDAEYCDRLCQKEAEGRYSPACVRCTAPFTLKDSKRVHQLRRYCTVKCIALTKMPQAVKRDKLLDRWSRDVKKRDGYRCRFLDWTYVRREALTEDEWGELGPFRGMPCSRMLTSHHLAKRSVWPERKYDLENGVTLCMVHHKQAIHNPRLQPIMFKLGLLVSRKPDYTDANGTDKK